LTKRVHSPYDAEVKIVNVHEAKTHLSRLLGEVEHGEEITIARAGVPVAKLVPAASIRTRKLGAFAGKVWIAEDFDIFVPPGFKKT